MLLALGTEELLAGLGSSAMPMPAVVQEFVNHGGRLAKVYAAGQKVGKQARRVLRFAIVPDTSSVTGLHQLQGFHP